MLSFIFLLTFLLLLKGTVPVYWGDHTHLKTLIPHPKSVIFVSDFKGDYAKLANYLTYLSQNETAYEEHRNWRKNFSSIRNTESNDLLRNSWYCNVCNWAIHQMSDRDNSYHNNGNNTKNENGHISQNDENIKKVGIGASKFEKSTSDDTYSNFDRHNVLSKNKKKHRTKQNDYARVVDICE